MPRVTIFFLPFTLYKIARLKIIIITHGVEQALSKGADLAIEAILVSPTLYNAASTMKIMRLLTGNCSMNTLKNIAIYFTHIAIYITHIAISAKDHAYVIIDV